MYKTGVTGSVPCTVAAFGDPSVGFLKSCFIRPNLFTLDATPKPTITGTATVGHTLTAQPHTWKPSGVALSYQWRRNGTAIPGATGQKYRVAAADLKATITVSVTSSKQNYKTVTQTSKATGKVKAGTLHTATPKVTGRPKVGSLLTANPGAWSPAGITFTYRWYRNSTAISGATGATYTATKADRGKKLRVKVYGHWSATRRPVARPRRPPP